jgi:hypothetical protein
MKDHNTDERIALEVMLPQSMIFSLLIKWMVFQAGLLD